MKVIISKFLKKMTEVNIGTGFGHNPIINGLKPKPVEEIIEQQVIEESPSGTIEVMTEKERAPQDTKSPLMKPSRKEESYKQDWIPGTDTGKDSRREYQQQYRQDVQPNNV